MLEMETVAVDAAEAVAGLAAGAVAATGAAAARLIVEKDAFRSSSLSEGRLIEDEATGALSCMGETTVAWTGGAWIVNASDTDTQAKTVARTADTLPLLRFIVAFG